MLSNEESSVKEALSHLLILEQLKEGDKYPYQIIQGVTARFRSVYKPSTGVIYPSLYRLIEKGYVVKRKRYYHITGSGLEKFNDEYDEFKTRIEDFWQEKQFLRQYHESLKRLSRVIYQADREYMEKYEEEIVSTLNELAENIEKLDPL